MSGRRTLVLACLPKFCPVCSGDGQVQRLDFAAPQDYGPVPCPRCTEHLPVLHLPMRRDLPRGAA